MSDSANDLEAVDVKSTRLEGEQATCFQPVAVLSAPAPSPAPRFQAHQLVREVEDQLRQVPANGQHGEVRMRLLVERLLAIVDSLRQAHEELDGRLSERTGELSRANAGLQKQISEIAKAERRLATEHAVARILTASTSLADAAPRILQEISQCLGWDVGVLWTLDRDAEVLRCTEVWHAPTVEIPVFEQVSRLRTFAAGIGLPGRVWAGNSSVWIADVTRDADLPRTALAAREGLHAAAGFPIRNGIESFGVMEFFSAEIRQPDEELVQMMASIGSQFSHFLERIKAEKALFLKEAELCIARKIQQGLVAKAPPALAGFDVAGVSHCAAETGGDYFDFFPLLDSCQGIVVADASGHGLGPALLITETRAYLRAFALTSQDVGHIVALVNRRLADDVGDHFVTLFLARLDPSTNSLLYSGAGHPKGCILDHSGNLKAFLESLGPALGIFPEGDFPIAPAITLEPGDAVLLLTDGILEARAPDGTAFGFQRAIDIVRVYRRDTAAVIVHNLYHAVRAFSHNYAQIDDMTAVVIKLPELRGPNRPEIVKLDRAPAPAWAGSAPAVPTRGEVIKE